jgi:hypothetical protein
LLLLLVVVNQGQLALISTLAQKKVISLRVTLQVYLQLQSMLIHLWFAPVVMIKDYIFMLTNHQNMIKHYKISLEDFVIN